MTIKCVIDNREIDLINMLGDNIITEQLNVGDIIFRDSENDNIILVIERKTLNDLKASILDGRAREQKARLLANFPTNRIMYLIEGNIMDKENINKLPIDTLLGSLINTQLRDNIKVYKTNCIKESVEFIKKLHSKLEKDNDIYFSDCEIKNTEESYAFTLKTSKKANMTPKVWYIKMLSLIPQVTEKIASVIINIYPTIKDLVLEYEKTPDNKRNSLLADLTLNIKNEKTRRIGIKISNRIYNFLYGLDIDSKNNVNVNKKLHMKRLLI